MLLQPSGTLPQEDGRICADSPLLGISSSIEKELTKALHINRLLLQTLVNGINLEVESVVKEADRPSILAPFFCPLRGFCIRVSLIMRPR
jgi:hypothetical protein